MVDIISGGLKMIAGVKSGHLRKDASRDAEADLMRTFREAIASSERLTERQQDNLVPYRQSGLVGLRGLTNRIKSGELLEKFGMDDFSRDAGYRFRLDEGQRALDRQNNANRGIFSGRQLRDAERFGQRFASEEYGLARDRFNQDQDRRFTKLYSLANIGERATGSANASLADLSHVRADLMTGRGEAAAEAERERGLIGAQTWTNVINDGISMLESIPGLPRLGG